MYFSAALELYYIFINSNSVCRMLYSLNYFVDPVSSGLIGILPDNTAGLLRFKCVLTLVTVSVIVSALKSD